MKPRLECKLQYTKYGWSPWGNTRNISPGEETYHKFSTHIKLSSETSFQFFFRVFRNWCNKFINQTIVKRNLEDFSHNGHPNAIFYSGNLRKIVFLFVSKFSTYDKCQFLSYLSMFHYNINKLILWENIYVTRNSYSRPGSRFVTQISFSSSNSIKIFAPEDL